MLEFTPNHSSPQCLRQDLLLNLELISLCKLVAQLALETFLSLFFIVRSINMCFLMAGFTLFWSSKNRTTSFTARILSTLVKRFIYHGEFIIFVFNGKNQVKHWFRWSFSFLLTLYLFQLSLLILNHNISVAKSFTCNILCHFMFYI